jgi:hypothetical protein
VFLSERVFEVLMAFLAYPHNMKVKSGRKLLREVQTAW